MPVNRFTQREFLYLDDVLAAQKVAAEKCMAAAASLSDPQLKQLCQSTAYRHQQQFARLLRHVDQAAGYTYQPGTFPGTYQYQAGQTGPFSQPGAPGTAGTTWTTSGRFTQ